MSRKRMLLVIRADGQVRIVKRPRLMADEVAIPIDLVFPDTWGRTLSDQAITIKVPDFVPEVIQPEGSPT